MGEDNTQPVIFLTAEAQRMQREFQNFAFVAPLRLNPITSLSTPSAMELKLVCD
jgi:hypothetical protein